MCEVKFSTEGEQCGITFLGWTMVLARSWSPWTVATSLLNTHIATLEVVSVQGFDGGLSLLSEGKFDEAKTTRVVGVRVTHDVSVLHLSILLEERDEFIISDARCNSSDEEIRARVFGASF